MNKKTQVGTASKAIYEKSKKKTSENAKEMNCYMGEKKIIRL